MGTSIIVLSINKSTYLSWFNKKISLTIIPWRQSEYCLTIPVTKAKGLFNNIHDIYFVVKTFLLQLFWLLI